MTPQDLQARTRTYSHRCVDVAEALPATRFGLYAADQLLRSGMSVGSNYRAACHGRTKAEFCAKLGIVEEELDETLFWFDAILTRRVMREKRLQPLVAEGDEHLKIVAASLRTAKRNKP
ncbi:MAG: four helix bundle protein [Tepidisphaeraceae bacterium]